MKGLSTKETHFGNSMALFPPWKPDSWIRVDDSVRGGASKSYLEYWNGLKDDEAAIFRGHLDITVLGGAGFASQKLQYSTPLDLRCDSKNHRRTGLKLSIRPQYRVTGMPSDFTITLKTQPPPPAFQPKPRSQLTYEATFVAPLPSHDVSRGEGKNVAATTTHKAVSVVLPFDSFTPTFRGRTVPRESPQWKEMDLGQLYELGIMCRSEFGKQQGDFALVLERIEVTTLEDSHVWSWRRCKAGIFKTITMVGRLEAWLWARLMALLCGPAIPK